MSQLNVYGEKLIQIVNQGSLSEPALREIENNSLLRKASGFLKSVKDFAYGQGSMLLATGLSNLPFYEVTGENLRTAIESGKEKLMVRYLTQDGSVAYSDEQLTDIIVEALSNEVEVANLTNNVLAVITSITSNSDYTTVSNGLRAACANATTSAGAAFSEYINRAILSTSSPFELRKLMVQSIFPGPESQGFAIPTMGEVTGTTGLALWFHSGVEAISNVLQSLKIDFLGTISRAYNKYVETEMANAAAMAVGWKVLSYNFSKLFTDPLIFPLKNYTHLALNNSYIDLGIATDALITSIEDTVGLSSSIAIPTIGATWYIYLNKEDGQWHVGMQKHLYDFDAAHKLYVLASQTANTFKDVFMCFATNGMSFEIKDTGGIYSSVSQFNEYVYNSFRETEKIISLGLELLQSNDDIIKNAYYQDPDPDAARTYAYRWTNTYNGSSITEDPNFKTRLGLALASNNNSPASLNNLAYVCLKLSRYFNNLNNNRGLCQHLIVNGTLPGYMNVADDATVESQITTRVTGVVITAAIFTALVISARAIRDIRQIALDAQIIAQRAVFNAQTPVETARVAVLRATRWSKIAGSATSFTTGVASAGLTGSGVTFEGNNSIETQIAAIRSLIKI